MKKSEQFNGILYEISIIDIDIRKFPKIWSQISETFHDVFSFYNFPPMCSHDFSRWETL